jgi:kumamolisin
MPHSDSKPITGSSRDPAPGAVSIGGLSPDAEIEITVRLRSRSDIKTRVDAASQGALLLPGRRYIERGEYADLYGADPLDVQAVQNFATENQLTQVGACAANRSLMFVGSAINLGRAFGTHLRNYSYPLGQYRGREGELFVPNALVDIIQGVFGLDNRRQAMPSITTSRFSPSNIGGDAIERIVTNYAFPPDHDGSGECVAILEFGGALSPGDLPKYFQHAGMNEPPPPVFKNIGPGYTPNQDVSADQEVALDIELFSSLAPKAKIVAYSATNDEKGWVDALCAAVHNNEDHPSVIAISWGSPESQWEADKRLTLTEIFTDAVRLGVTICAASGDDGWAIDKNANARVNFPASSSLVLSCGGTAFNGEVETVWNEGRQHCSGGGVSDCVPKPTWQPQRNTVVPPPVPPRADPTFDGRQLPDVSGLASCCYTIYVCGACVSGVGGTSAVPPLWAALIARINQSLHQKGLSRIGYFLPLLYSTPALQAAFTDIQCGNNDPNGLEGYKAGPKWDACTGWGTPNGTKLLQELSKQF